MDFDEFIKHMCYGECKIEFGYTDDPEIDISFESDINGEDYNSIINFIKDNCDTNIILKVSFKGRIEY